MYGCRGKKINVSHKRKLSKHWKYTNLTLLGLSMVFGIVMGQWPWWNRLLESMGSFRYLGAFVGGMLFTSTFTVTTGIVVLLDLAKSFSPLEVGLVAGLGAVAGNVLMFKFVRDGVFAEVEEIYNQVDSRHHLIKLLHTKYFLWMLPVIGAVIILSPLPDELGITLMGISKMKMNKFLPISFILNSIGIFGVVWVANALSG
jgi:uncharacterized membrane protein YdjX (TVP38/TMEM64 family)